MKKILVINGGSSSIKFAIYAANDELIQTLSGKIDRIGQSDTYLTVTNPATKHDRHQNFQAKDFHESTLFLLNWLEERGDLASIDVVGHRVVHGMHHSAPELVTPSLLNELQKIIPFDPNHLPNEIGTMEAMRLRQPELPQVGCFDTAFHRDMPKVAKMIAIPRVYESKGVERYGFHGISYSFLLQELKELGDESASSGRVILAHLGSGASLAAVLNGTSIDTSMGFTPTSGLMMGTRSGDLDPGIASYLERSENMSTAEFYDMVNHRSGLLGVSELSSDMRELLDREATDPRAKEAISLFCYQAKKWIGAFTAALGGLETLVFSGGIGENCPEIREKICEGLEFLGIEIDELKNRPKNKSDAIGVISTPNSKATVRVIRTNEELMIARSICRLFGFGNEITLP